MFGIHCILCLYIYRHLLFTKIYLKGSMVLKLIIRWWFWWYHFWCIASAVSKSSWNCHLISSPQVADHSIVMVHWYGTWMTSMSSWLLFGYHQKYSHSTSVVTCRVCISPRVHQDNKAITIQSLGHTQSNPILYTPFGRKPMKFLNNECDMTMAWALSLKNDVINEVFSLGSRRVSISLNTHVQMCIWLRALVLSLVIIWLKCVVYLVICHPHKSGCPINAS